MKAVLISVASPYPRPKRESHRRVLAIKTGFAQKVMKWLVAIDTYFPTSNEISLAETRARNYWNRNAPLFGHELRYLAVDTSKWFPGEIQDLYPKLINF